MLIQYFSNTKRYRKHYETHTFPIVLQYKKKKNTILNQYFSNIIPIQKTI